MIACNYHALKQYQNIDFDQIVAGLDFVSVIKHFIIMNL